VLILIKWNDANGRVTLCNDCKNVKCHSLIGILNYDLDNLIYYL